MEVKQQVGDKKFLTRYHSSSDVFTELASDDARRKHLDWIIRDKDQGAVRMIDVKVQVPDRSLLDLEVDPLGQIADVKKNLQAELNMALVKMCLMWNGKVLQDDSSVYSQEIIKGCTLQLIKKKEVEFSVTVPGGELVHLRMCRTSSVGEVMQAVRRIKPMEETSLHLYHNGIMLCGAKLLRDYKIGEGSAKDILQLAPGRKPISIVLRSLTGWYAQLDVDADERVADVKRKVETLNGDLLADRQILIFNERTLHDDQPLSRYDIQDGDHVYVRVQLQGGGPEVHVVTSSGQYIPFPTFKFDTVQYVRQRVLDQFGIPMDCQELVIHRDHTLRGNHMIKERAHWCRVL